MINNADHHAKLDLKNREKLQQILHALDSMVRLDILHLLMYYPMISVGEISKRLNLPFSTTALAIKTLEDAGIIGTKIRPGVHGNTKLCWIYMSKINIDLNTGMEQDEQFITLPMPVGGYCIAENIQPTCGLISEKRDIGLKDTISSFYLPERFQAQLVWFYSGYLEYRFALPKGSKIGWIELSFEACSEAPGHKDPWPSDIYVSFNGRRLGLWTCPSDCGGRHGLLTPDWWKNDNSQYGFMKTWRVDETGSYLDQVRIGDTVLRDLELENKEYLTAQIGVDTDAEHVGGINLFGEKCGDYPQALLLRIGVL